MLQVLGDYCPHNKMFWWWGGKRGSGVGRWDGEAEVERGTSGYCLHN